MNKSVLLLLLVIGLLTDISLAGKPLGAPSYWSWNQKKNAEKVKDLMEQRNEMNMADFLVI
uniref:Uncharacterized LOC104266803 n=1 Tax=Ciona intestinalis TaxID=7719 RepID=F7AYJ6_CIOIN